MRPAGVIRLVGVAIRLYKLQFIIEYGIVEMRIGRQRVLVQVDDFLAHRLGLQLKSAKTGGRSFISIRIRIN